MNTKALLKSLPALVLASLLFCTAGVAQETTAGVQGTVKDPSGSTIPNATVEVASPALLGVRKVQTDGSGGYRFAVLAPGVYTLTVTATGFRTYRQTGLELTVGRLPNVDIKLEVGAATQTVEVSDVTPVVDVTRSNAAQVVDQQILNNIPKGRSFQSVIPFAAGARQEPLQGGTSTRDNGFQIDGASDSENVYLVDGVNITNIQNGGVGKNFQVDFTEEVQIKSGGFEAEYGGALGGVINVVPKRGSNQWHGALLTYYRTNSLNANDGCASGYTSGNANPAAAGFSTVCGLRLDPTLPSINTTTRLDGTPQYYVPAKDGRNIIEPGFQLGGPILKDRLWASFGYIPLIDRISRTTTFTGLNPGPRTLTQAYTQHNMYNRLDYRAINSLRLFGAWNYSYSRNQGQLGQPNSAGGQLNTGASTDPNTFRSDNGTVNPNALYTFGGDWTPTSKLVVSVRYGYFFNNNEQRGTPVGTRYLYQNTVNATSKDLAGNPFPASSFNSSGFANIPSNLATAYDAYKRKGINADVSYFAGRLLGSHSFKGGYFWQRQSNDVLTNFQGGRVDLYYGQSYSPVTSTTACDAVKTQNASKFGQSACQGQFGYFIVGTGVTNNGVDNQTAQAVYVQDSWNVGHGLTLNLGVRFDEETQPPYDPKRFPTVKFGFGDKIAPRLGGAYDVLHNGKLKVYASYGKFYDIMKLGLARGSFGSDYWHNCVYALDDTAYTNITPSFPAGGGCPASGPAPGVTGRFIENVDFRATKADPRDPAISPDLKPMLQHEVAAGVDWAINSNWSLETRYTRKRLDRTIEDMSITDNLGFYIGNPGSKFADFLHRPVSIPDANGNAYLTTVPFCAECPGVVPAIRRYDGLEFRLSNRGTGKWFTTMSYTYSRLTGNYAGLTNTDTTDGGGGRHAPNNGRAFDLPTQTYLPNGKIDDGPLGTDRPNTGKVFAYYRQKWHGMETDFGVVQSAFQGTPISTCLSVVGTASACQWAEGRGNFVKLRRSATGEIVSDGVVQGARSDNYIQTDLSIKHIVRVREGMNLTFDVNAQNVFNQRAAVGYNQIAIGGASQLISPTRASRFSGDPQVDWGKVLNGYNYLDALNGKGAFAGVQTPVTLASRYGLPTIFQLARNLRLGVRFTF